MEETKVSKREWVKTAAIIFLAILLVLTFFSNTIMNATLPEVAAQQIERAMRIADHFARNTKDNPLLLTITALFNLFRDIFVVNYLGWLSRHKGMPFPDDMSLMRSLKKSNLYAVKEVKQAAARWNNRRVFNILGLLREYDAKSKGIDTGGADDGELLRELLLKIFMA